jgi:hypothetical protein
VENILESQEQNQFFPRRDADLSTMCKLGGCLPVFFHEHVQSFVHTCNMSMNINMNETMTMTSNEHDREHKHDHEQDHEHEH